MKRLLVACVAAALLGCGGDEVRFDLESPPKWLTDLDQMLPAKALLPHELEASCLSSFVACTALVRPSRSMTRKATFTLAEGNEVRITYEAGEDANPVTVTLRPDKPATVPVRRNGGTLTFRCRSASRCAVGMQ